MGLQRVGHDLATEQQQQCMPATVLSFGNTVMTPYNPITPDVVATFQNPQFYGGDWPAGSYNCNKPLMKTGPALYISASWALSSALRLQVFAPWIWNDFCLAHSYLVTVYQGLRGLQAVLSPELFLIPLLQMSLFFATFFLLLS